MLKYYCIKLVIEKIGVINLKITTLIENSEDEKKILKNEHGLSFFIESKYGNILFDTGKTGDFIDNAKKLNIDLSTIDTLILSHSHYDHCGGVKRLLENYDIKLKIVIGNDFFKNSNRYHYTDKVASNVDFAKELGYKYVGIDFDENYIKSKNIDTHYVKDSVYKINDEIYVFSNFKKLNNFEKSNVNMKIKVSEDKYEVDTFSDEICVGVKTAEGMIILMGCAHPGFLNMIESIKENFNEKIIGVIGGTHLVEADDERLDKSVEHINKLNIKLLGLSHCTGEKASKIFNEKCKGTFVNRTGTVIEKI